MRKTDKSTFSHTIKKTKKTSSFSFEADGYTSQKYLLEVIAKAYIKNVNAELNYPEYLEKNQKK